jgi:heme-degrading monooxygenase HmoA
VARSALPQVLRAAAPKQKPWKAGGSIMIMRITWGKLRAGSWQDFERTYNATVAGKEVKGLRGRWLAQDVNDPNGGFAVSLWDTLEDMHAYEQSAVFKQEIQPTLQPFFVGEYHTYRCDVKYSQ